MLRHERLLTANELTAVIMALITQEERKAISARTKTRGVKLGCPNGASHLLGENNGSKRGADERAEKLASVVKEVQKAGATSLREIAEELNRRSMTTAKGGTCVQHEEPASPA